MKQELRLSGTGGQGLITAGIILAEAALLDGKLAIQSQSYGPEARGGASKAEVIISDEAIHFPKVTDPNLLLAMSQEAATKYSHDLTAGSVMITDSLFVSDVPDFGGKVYELPITHSAKEVLGKALFANKKPEMLHAALLPKFSGKSRKAVLLPAWTITSSRWELW